jgi:hypothetical protein
MRRKVLVGILTAVFSAMMLAPASAAEQHPPKFGPHDTQCQSDPNQPNCPGSH